MGTTLEMTTGVLATTPQRWASLVESVPVELLLRPPSPGEWSAADCLRHLLSSERTFFRDRLRHILEGRPELVPFDPNAPREPDPEQSPGDMAAAFLAARVEHLAILGGLTPADLKKSSFHPEYGVDIYLGQVLDVWAGHDLMHTVQAEEALMQVFIPGTSVWRDEFADHDVEARV